MDTLARSQIVELFDDCKTNAPRLRVSTPKERKAKLRKLENWIHTNRAEIHMAVYRDLQKPTQETDITELFVVLAEIRKAKRNLRRWMAPTSVTNGSIVFLGTRAESYPESKGVCLIISPWNYPFQLAIAPLVSAIAAGNTVIIKPSEFSENTSNLIKKMCDEIFEKDEVRVVLGGIKESQELLSLPFDHIFFTGSPHVGKIVMEAAAKHLTSVTLELGGKSPTIVDKTANIKDAAAKIAWGKWLNAGQVCIAPDYLLVHEDIKEKLIEELVVQSTKLYGNQDDYSAIISRQHHNTINDLMADAIEKGADLEFGGKSDRANLRFTPTLLSNVSPDSILMKKEIFGPILPMITYRDLNKAIEIISKKEKPLALYIFSRSRKIIERIKTETTSGMMAINDTVIQFGHPNLPIGGVNHSGIGKAHGYHGFLEFSNQKAILRQRVGFTIPKLVYPPYGRLQNFIIELMLKYF